MSCAPPLRFPSIEGLRAFEASARLGTFEKAAEELSITASAIGKRVATLEDLLGAQLLVRSGKALALTAAGKEYLEQVRAALGLLAAMPLHRQASQRMERLRVCAPPTFARQILVPRLQAYTDTHPHVELEIVLSIPYLDTGGTDADIEIRNLDARPGDPATAGACLLMRDRLVPMAAPSLLERLPPLRVPQDLAHAPLLRTPLDPWTPWLRTAGLDWPEPAQGPRLVDLGLLLEAAVSGQGIALGRPTLACRWLEAGALRRLFDLSVTPVQQYHLMPHAGHEVATGFAHWLQATCAEVQAQATEILSRPA